MTKNKIAIVLIFSALLIGASCSSPNQTDKKPGNQTTPQKQTSSTEIKSQKSNNATVVSNTNKKRQEPTTTKEKTRKDTTQTPSTGDKTAKKEAEREEKQQELAKKVDKKKDAEDSKNQAIEGCTDPKAKNYNPKATKDDGSCKFVRGCTDSKAKNYNPQAVKNDGSCKYEIKGCTDPEAKNYNSEATEDDGSCNYVRGCTNPKASNYDPEAIKDDGSCIIKGCTDPEAKNYNPEANKNDSSCKFADKTYPVVDVVDGDTIEVKYNGTVEDVRLIGLNTTESKDPRKKVQCFSREATNAMKSLVSGKEVKMKKGPMSDNRGYYGRLLRYVYLPNGTHVNAWMVKKGYGYAYTKYPFSKQDQFTALEKQARENKLGLWADGVCEKEEQQTEENNTSDYQCSDNIYNCSDFNTYSKAKEVYDACDGVNDDVHRLDRDKDGIPCESLKQ